MHTCTRLDHDEMISSMPSSASSKGATVVEEQGLSAKAPKRRQSRKMKPGAATEPPRTPAEKPPGSLAPEHQVVEGEDDTVPPVEAVHGPTLAHEPEVPTFPAAAVSVEAPPPASRAGEPRQDCSKNAGADKHRLILSSLVFPYLAFVTFLLLSSLVFSSLLFSSFLFLFLGPSTVHSPRPWRLRQTAGARP